MTGDTTLDPLASWVEERLSSVLAGADFVQLISGGTPERVRATVSGSVTRRADLVEVHLRITEPGSGGRVAVPAAASFDPDNRADSALVEMEERLLGALAIRFDRRFEAAGTTDETLPIKIPRYQAYRQFLRGQELFGEQDYDAAVSYMLKAYEIDPTYGKAAVFGAIAMAYSGQLAAADSFMTAVLATGDSLADRDRAFGEWLQADVRGDRRKAVHAAREFERTSAGASPSAYAVAATEAMKFNRLGEALRTYERVNVEHGWLHDFAQLWEWWAGAHHMRGDHRSELAKALEGRERFPEALRLIRTEVRARAALGHTDRVQQLIEEALTLAPGGVTPADVAWTAAQELDAHGQEAAAAATRRTALAWLNQRQDPVRKERMLQVQLLLELGDADGAYRLLESLPPRADPDHLGLTGLVAAGRGDTAAARELLIRLDTMRSPYLSGRNLLMAGGIRAALGQEDAAVQTLRRAFAKGLPFGVELHALPMLRPLARRGELVRLLRPKD
jgi:tetratricopeptide (TPR) repeat protein